MGFLISIIVVLVTIFLVAFVTDEITAKDNNYRSRTKKNGHHSSGHKTIDKTSYQANKPDTSTHDTIDVDKDDYDDFFKEYDDFFDKEDDPFGDNKK